MFYSSQVAVGSVSFLRWEPFDYLNSISSGKISFLSRSPDCQSTQELLMFIQG